MSKEYAWQVIQVGYGYKESYRIRYRPKVWWHFWWVNLRNFDWDGNWVKMWFESSKAAEDALFKRLKQRDKSKHLVSFGVFEA